MEFTTLIFGQECLIQSEEFEANTYWRIIWLQDDTRDILHQEEGVWCSHTAKPTVTRKIGSIIDKQLAKRN